MGPYRLLNAPTEQGFREYSNAFWGSVAISFSKRVDVRRYFYAFLFEAVSPLKIRTGFFFFRPVRISPRSAKPVRFPPDCARFRRLTRGLSRVPSHGLVGWIGLRSNSIPILPGSVRRWAGFIFRSNSNWFRLTRLNLNGLRNPPVGHRAG